MFGQGCLVWVYSFVMWRTCGRRRGGAVLLHMTVHYATGMCRSACEINQSHSTGRYMKQLEVWCLCGCVLRRTFGRRCKSVMYWLQSLLHGCFNMRSILNFSEIFAGIYRMIQEEKVNILGNNSICHYKENVLVWTRVKFWMHIEIVPLKPLHFILWSWMKSEIDKRKVDARDELLAGNFLRLLHAWRKEKINSNETHAIFTQ
jgi:hypothetical protein